MKNTFYSVLTLAFTFFPCSQSFSQVKYSGKQWNVSVLQTQSTSSVEPNRFWCDYQVLKSAINKEYK
jgi:glycopeptide antibiotics resistance protein